MNTNTCFIFLLVVGLSAQKSEFEIDFEIMVNTVRLKDTSTLLVSTTIHATNLTLLRMFKKCTFLNIQTSDILSLNLQNCTEKCEEVTVSTHKLFLILYLFQSSWSECWVPECAFECRYQLIHWLSYMLLNHSLMLIRITRDSIIFVHCSDFLSICMTVPSV